MYVKIDLARRIHVPSQSCATPMTSDRSVSELSVSSAFVS